MILDLRKHTSKDLQPQILLVAQPVGPPLDNPNLIVQPFHESQGNLIVGMTICSDAVPMSVHQFGKLFVGLEALPLQRGSPIFKETPCPAFPLIVPQLAESLLEQI